MVFKKGQLLGDENPAKRPEVRAKISAALKNRTFTKEAREKMSKAQKGRICGMNNPNYSNHTPLSEERKEQIKLNMKKWWQTIDKEDPKIKAWFKKRASNKIGKGVSVETKKKLSDANLGKGRKRVVKFCSFCGKEVERVPSQSKVNCFCSSLCLKNWMGKNNPMHLLEVRSKVSETIKSLWKNEEYASRLILNMKRKPNNIEKSLTDLFKLKYIDLVYVGDGSFWIGPCLSGKRRNPDFINKEKKAILLYNGTYWHTEKDILEQKKDYEDKGYFVLCIDEIDIANKEKLIYKIRRWLDCRCTTRFSLG